jgi:signal transduction histidine kinase/CheY-like chemotaxis protein
MKRLSTRLRFVARQLHAHQAGRPSRIDLDDLNLVAVRSLGYKCYMRSIRNLAGGVALTAIYVAAGKAGLLLASLSVSVTPVWPPAGIALAAVLLWGPRVWPAIVVGAFIVNSTTTGSAATSATIAAGNALEAVLGGWLICRFAAGPAAFERMPNVLRFAFFAATGASVAATVGVVALATSGGATWSSVEPIWMTWFLGDVAGSIVVAPLLLLWHRDPSPRWHGRQRAEIAALLITLAALCVFVFVKTTLPFAFLAIPLAVWAGARFGGREASTVALLLSVVAVGVTVRGIGPFAATSMNKALLATQTFTVVTAMLGLMVGAAASELRRAQEGVRQLNADLERRVSARTTQLELVVEHLRATEARFEEAQDVARIGSWDWGLAENRVWWSAELGVLLGIEGVSPGYDAFLRLVHPDDRDRLEEAVRGLIERDIPLEMEYRVIRPDGSERIFVSKGRLIRGSDATPVRMLGTVQDITDRKHLEEQLRQGQKMEAVGMLAGGIAHDFNNLLTVIAGFTDMVINTIADDDPRQADLLEVRKAAERAAALTRQLLAFSRRQVLQPRVLDLNELVLSVQKLLRRTIGEDIDLVIDAVAPHRVRADPGQLEQVVLNLAVNARDAMPEGGQLRFATSSVQVAAGGPHPYRECAPGTYAQLTVTDTGVGMPPDVQSRIFEPFFTTKEPGKGTGLGLATVYGIVRQSGGCVHVVSEVGRGTSFHVLLPAVELEGERAATAAPDADVFLGGETVLLAEDDAGVRRLASQVLAKHGYTVLAARDGDEALTMAAGSMIDLLITDLVMPGLTGRDLAARLAADHPTLRVLFTTGYADWRVHAAEGDRERFLPKPFLPIDLLRRVRETLDAAPTRTGS